MSGLSQDEIRAGLQAARRLGMSRVRLRDGSDSFSAVLGALPEPEFLDDTEVAIPAGPATTKVKAPVVGYIRLKSNLGDEIEAGAALAEVQALGLANDVLAKSAGTIVEILVQDGDPVEYGQALFVLEDK